MRWVGIGWYIAICIAGGAFLGYWLDGIVHTKPLLTFVGLGFGLVVAFFGVYRMLRSAIKEERNEDKGEK